MYLYTAVIQASTTPSLPSTAMTAGRFVRVQGKAQLQRRVRLMTQVVQIGGQ